MSAADVAALVAACAAAVAALGSVVAVVLLGRRVRDLQKLVGDLRRETVPLLRDARIVVEEAATEMVRVGDVLGSAESVSATVDSASRLTYRAFANPVVKFLAFSTGMGAAARRLVGRSTAETGDTRRPAGAAPVLEVTAPAAATTPRRHRRSRVRR